MTRLFVLIAALVLLVAPAAGGRAGIRHPDRAGAPGTPTALLRGAGHRADDLARLRDRV